MLYAHVAGSVTALSIGPFNFPASIRNRHRGLHRALGRIYRAGVGVGGLTGVYLAFAAIGGLVSTIGFLGLSLYWLVSSYYAVKTIRARQTDCHRRWMIRHYAEAVDPDRSDNTSLTSGSNAGLPDGPLCGSSASRYWQRNRPV